MPSQPRAQPLGRARRLLPVVLAGLAVAACVAGPRTAGTSAEAPRARLNSELIAERFGSYGVEVLESDSRIRVSNLYSVHDNRRVGRTFAVVVFPTTPDSRVAAEHRRVVAGGSIGEVFTRRGWTVGRRLLAIHELPPPSPADRVSRLMGLAAPVPLALEAYTLVVARDGLALDYATIAEVHHPEHLRLGDLRALRGRDVPAGQELTAELAEVLELMARAARGPLDLAAESAEVASAARRGNPVIARPAVAGTVP